MGDEPVDEPSTPAEGRINFVDGGMLYPVEAPTISNSNVIDKISVDVDNANPAWLDPVTHNDFNLVQMSLKSGERRFALSKFNDMNIFKLVRTYLAFLHNQSPNVCV